VILYLAKNEAMMKRLQVHCTVLCRNIHLFGMMYSIIGHWGEEWVGVQFGYFWKFKNRPPAISRIRLRIEKAYKKI
jgi:hypothetical protein